MRKKNKILLDKRKCVRKILWYLIIEESLMTDYHISVSIFNNNL